MQAHIAMQRGELEHATQLLAQIGAIAEETGNDYGRVLYLVGKAHLARLLSYTQGGTAILWRGSGVDQTLIGRSQQYIAGTGGSRICNP